MFHTFITLFTAATFVAHGLLGCCWHHTHSHIVDGEWSSVSEFVCGERHDHSAHRHPEVPSADAEDPQDFDSEAPHSPRCEESDCVFVRVLVSSTSAVGIPLALFAVPLPGLPFETVNLSPTARQAFRKGGVAPSSTAPLNALSQVWLI